MKGANLIFKSNSRSISDKMIRTGILKKNESDEDKNEKKKLKGKKEISLNNTSK